MPRGGSNNWGPSIRRGPYGGDNDNGCWLWTGRKVGRYGYGKVTVGGKVKRVHREVFRAVYGWDPPVVRHRCDTPACWRPDHLLAGTVQDNTDDKVSRGRHQTGERCYNAVLTDELVGRVRRMYGAGWRVATIARTLGLRQVTVQSVTSGRTWRHVETTTEGRRSEPAA